MHKTLLPFIAIFALSCNADQKKESATAGASTTVEENLPYKATYSARFEMGNSKNVETLMKVWKGWDDNNFTDIRKYFADTMLFYLRDGGKISGPTDSSIASAQAARSNFAAVKSTVHTITALKSIDKNENWAVVWGSEVTTDKQGKTDSVLLQESWRFNKDGKIDLMYQYGRAYNTSPVN